MVKDSCLEYIQNNLIKIKDEHKKKERERERGHEQGVDKRGQAGS